MTDHKPRAGGRGRRPRGNRGSSAARQESKRASDSRKRLKARMIALEARYSTLHSWVGELHEAITGESIRAHPEDLEEE